MKLYIIVFIICLCLTGLCYHPAANAWFVLDDYFWLAPQSVPELLHYFHGSWGHGTAYRPLTRVSYSVDYFLFGEHPLGWHLHNFVLHAGNATLLFFLVVLVRRNRSEAALMALLFASSPWVHENLAWISGRTHLLGALFYLSALIALVKYCRTGSARRFVFLALSSLFFMLGLLSYESLFSFPLVAGLLLLQMKEVPRRSRCLVALYHGLLLLLFMAFRFWALNRQWGGTNLHHQDYIAGSLMNLWDVLRIFFGHFRLQLAGALVVGIVLALNVVKANRKYVSEFSYLLIAGMFLYLPFIVVQGVAFRFLYLVQAVYFALVVQALVSILQQFAAAKWIVRGLFICLVLANVKVSYSLAREWNEAGHISRSIPAAVKEIYPVKLEGYDYIFYNVPDSSGHAGVFRSYLDLAIVREYEDFDGSVYRTKDIVADPHFMNHYQGRAKYFVYLDETQDIEEISPEQWRSLLE